MLVSTKGRYTLRMMIDIATYVEQGHVALREVSAREGISVKYLEQLTRPMVQSGLLRSVRGQGGGYVLGKPASEIPVGDILRAAEGSTAPVACLGDDDYECPRRSMCSTIDFWKGLDEVVERYVDGVMLSDIVEQTQEVLASMPSITEDQIAAAMAQGAKC